MPDLGVYIHFPWCRALCPYCDFPVAVARAGDAIPHDAYLDAVLAELGERAPEHAGRRLVSIYVGGGTPSLWQPSSLSRVIAATASAFGAAPAALEITLEANPRDCTPARMAAWRDAGINRLSIGVQSTDPGTLATLGRDHRMGDGVRALEAALASGLFRVSADVIIGTPGRGRGPASDSDDALDPSLLTLAQSGVGHMSVYELTIEDRTAFGRAARAGTLARLDDETLARMYVAAHQALCARGFEHYEISSYARPGQRSVHNQLYWRGAEYLGLGNGAASFRRLEDGGGERVTNVRSVKRYLAARGAGRVAERESLGPDEVLVDLIWLGMRTADGVDAALLDRAPGLRAWLVSANLARPRDGRMIPTLQGFLYADRIAARVVAGLDETDRLRVNGEPAATEP